MEDCYIPTSVTMNDHVAHCLLRKKKYSSTAVTAGIRISRPCVLIGPEIIIIS